ncbi:MAG: 30S ribosomal protein S4 [Silvanigrellaceae bacterium]|nr:30S ribosomal protein S4 [Silvanigrellaceae bacterium]
MARYTGPVCRLCRREGVKLFLKGERCYTDKCAVDKRKTAPGQHGQRRGKLSDYGLHLREKQKLKRIYGVLERQFRHMFDKASHAKGMTGEALVQNLELRLDSVVFRLGWAQSRNAARQLVRHNHVLVNGQRRNIPSSVLRVGDTVTLVDASKEMPSVILSQESAKRDGHGCPSWMKLISDNFNAEIIARPAREDIQIPVREQLIVEFYSQ